MARYKFRNLREIRQQFLGFQRGFVSRTTGLSEERLAEIEDQNDPPTVYEIERLSRLYGIESEVLAEEPIKLRPEDSVTMLALQDEFRDVSATTKSKIIAAAGAARDLISLRRLSGEPEARQIFLNSVRVLKKPDSGTLPFAQGRHYARLVRKRAKLGLRPIESIRDFISDHFPGISVLYANLGREGVAGLTFADVPRGPAIVLNLDGKNANPCVNRFSLAHELCHLLVDWNRQQPLATLSGFLDVSQLDQEQRANAFAVRLLCPEKVLSKLDDEHTPEKTARILIEKYGIHFNAARLYIKNVTGRELPYKRPTTEMMSSTTSERWAKAERPQGIDNFPLEDVPPERRTFVAQYASRLYADGLIQRDKFADFLGITPNQDIERVLDFYEIDRPNDFTTFDDTFKRRRSSRR